MREGREGERKKNQFNIFFAVVLTYTAAAAAATVLPSTATGGAVISLANFLL